MTVHVRRCGVEYVRHDSVKQRERKDVIAPQPNERHDKREVDMSACKKWWSLGKPPRLPNLLFYTNTVLYTNTMFETENMFLLGLRKRCLRLFPWWPAEHAEGDYINTLCGSAKLYCSCWFCSTTSCLFQLNAMECTLQNLQYCSPLLAARWTRGRHQ